MTKMHTLLLPLFFTFLTLSQSQPHSDAPPSSTVCIIGAGIGGSSVAHFIRKYSPDLTPTTKIQVFERNNIVGGRIATVTIAGETFEAGASILHPKNLHAVTYTKLLKLKDAVDRFSKYYEETGSRPIFETVDEMLKWSGLFNLTTRTLQDELVDAGLSPLLINELVTVITRINYGQSVYMSGLGGAVSLAGSGGGLWSIEGGNFQMAAGLINRSEVALHLQEEIKSVADLGDYYELNSTKGNSYICDVAVVATPLDELNIQFIPPISIPERKLQHTHATFVRGLLNPVYFGLKAAAKIPDLVATLEDPKLPFTSISVLKEHNEEESTYKIFSRQPMTDILLDSIFSVRKETIRINWAAYPQYHAPEIFAPFILDGRHLYYVNAFENAASTMETSAVAAENIARLILSRYFGKVSVHSSNLNLKASSQEEDAHLDL
ncbi:hypothetical protein TSUD_303860 [Trifolium subterraneum]|uniref:Prenylcysteine lyase domain-containing protein n=2 Tax=Trifolium TaxID=3898 RepID=A0A2Z6MBR4_TRISU|nr:hypothetical protein TSUD_303860 [Trifolium subterraneum]